MEQRVSAALSGRLLYTNLLATDDPLYCTYARFPLTRSLLCLVITSAACASFIVISLKLVILLVALNTAHYCGHRCQSWRWEYCTRLTDGVMGTHRQTPKPAIELTLQISFSLARYQKVNNLRPQINTKHRDGGKNVNT